VRDPQLLQVLVVLADEGYQGSAYSGYIGALAPQYRAVGGEDGIAVNALFDGGGQTLQVHRALLDALGLPGEVFFLLFGHLSARLT
jgi:hypothetical protein